MTKWCENSSPVAHLGKAQGVMSYSGCRQHQEMDRQSSPSVGGLVQQHQSRAWKGSVDFQPLVSAVFSRERANPGAVHGSLATAG